jgi:hypothetical protein
VVGERDEAAGPLLDSNFGASALKVGKARFAGLLRLLPRSIRVISDNMLQHDNPDHRRLRRLVDQAFSRHNVAVRVQRLVRHRDRGAGLCPAPAPQPGNRPAVELAQQNSPITDYQRS